MGVIVDYFAAEHRDCDEVFAVAEEAAQIGDLAGCQVRFQQFQTAMERHFQKEEQELFPAFEEASGIVMGPTRVMRLEHQQMREIFVAMNDVLASGDLEEVPDHPHAPGEPIYPVALFNSPGHVIARVSAYRERPRARPLPLFSYGAVGWQRGWSIGARRRRTAVVWRRPIC